MLYLCQRLIEDVCGDPMLHDVAYEKKYNDLYSESCKFPNFNVQVESDLTDIRKQWVVLTRSVVLCDARTNTKVVTLFCITKHLMEIYVKVNPDIARLHAYWLHCILTERFDVNNYYKINVRYIFVFILMAAINILFYLL